MMNRRWVVQIVFLTLVTFVLVSPVVWGAEEDEGVIVVLPESVNVTGTELILGTIAEISGPDAMVEKVSAINAGTAPIRGSSRRLTKAQIEIRLRQGGLDLSKIEFQGADTVLVYGIASSDTPGVVNQGETGFPIYEVVVASGDLARGHIITIGDLTVEEREFRSGQPDPRSVDGFVGLRTNRYVSSGTALTHLNVEIIPVIERGAQVTILVRTGSLVVSAPGVARGSGGLGEIISVENTLSRQVVSGEIIDAQTVEVNMRGSGTP